MTKVNARVSYPWLMQILLILFGAIGAYFLGWRASNPDDRIVVGIVSKKTGWVTANESVYSWSGFLGAPAEDVAIVGGVLVAILPLGVWARRRQCKPRGLVCSRCHKDMSHEQALALHGDVLVCHDCEMTMKGMGETDFIHLWPECKEA